MIPQTHPTAVVEAIVANEREAALA
jgi:hypothetical protein